MKFRIMSNYDVAKNFFHIIETHQKINEKSINIGSDLLFKNIKNQNKCIQCTDTFEKLSDKAVK